MGILNNIFKVINFNYNNIPKETSIKTPSRKKINIKFLKDISYIKNEKRIHDQEIFTNVFKLIDDAEDFIVLDMFLYNDYHDLGDKYIELSENMTDHLIKAKKRDPNIKIFIITDEINTFYGSYKNSYFERLRDSDIKIIMTDLNKLRESNKLWSLFWKMFLQWFKIERKGFLKNPFSKDAPRVSLLSYFKSFNFKANHRKVLVTDKGGLVTSANVHDASSFHTNIGFLIKGCILKDLLETERQIAELSGANLLGVKYTEDNYFGEYNANILTEGKIYKELMNELKGLEKEDEIHLGMFYLSDRSIIESLIETSKRGVKIKMILDPNKEAFGREKSGIPNRQVAHEIKEKSDIEIRWANTTGEQFHAKFILFQKRETATIIGGSANYTKRNIRDYNLETNIKIEAENDSKIIMEVKNMFYNMWNNKKGEYTLSYDKYKESSIMKYWIYRFQEWSGFSTF